MSRMRGLFHPSRSRLRDWLNTGEPLGVGEHIDRCDVCADRLEEIDRDDRPAAQSDAPSPLRQALSELIAPPDDLVDRVLSGVDGRVRAERELALIAGLFSIGVETAQLLLDPGNEHDSPSERGNTPKGDRLIVDHQEDNDRE